jgi:hypothetical protein
MTDLLHNHNFLGQIRENTVFNILITILTNNFFFHVYEDSYRINKKWSEKLSNSLAVFNSNDNGPVPHFENTCNIIGNLDGTVLLIIINVLDYEAGSVMT